MDDLCRTALDDPEGRPQDFMPAGQVAQALAQDVNVEGTEEAATAHPRQARSVFQVRTIIPDSLLGKRHGHGSRARDADDLRRCGGSRPSAAVDEFGKRGYRWMIGDGGEAQLDPERGMDVGCNTRADQGVASEAEEIVVSADTGNVESLRPDFGKPPLGFRPRFITPGAVASRQGILAERGSIDLVGPVVGQM